MRITKLHLILFAIIAVVLGFWGYQFMQDRQRERELQIARLAREDERRRIEAELRRKEEQEKQQENRKEEAVRIVALAGEYWKAAVRQGRNVVKGQETLHEAKIWLGEEDFDTASALARRAIEELQNAPVKNRYYTVRHGDTLWKIAKMSRHYGRGALWTLIWRANQKKIPDFDLLYPRQVLLIPRLKQRKG